MNALAKQEFFKLLCMHAAIARADGKDPEVCVPLASSRAEYFVSEQTVAAFGEVRRDAMVHLIGDTVMEPAMTSPQSLVFIAARHGVMAFTTFYLN